jgi:4-amino-4-deoxy-L-arabinose transferase-like glycosyltransferase
MNFMTHTFTLTLALTGAVMVAKARRCGKARWGWTAGFLVGMISLIRPLEALAIAGLLGIWALGFGGRRLKTSAIAGLVLGAMLVGSSGLYYNKRITGDPIRFPFEAYTDKYYEPGSNSLGFGPERGTSMRWTTHDPFPGHGLIDVLINANFNIFSINIDLFGWGTGSLFLILVLFFSGAMRRSDYIMLAAICAIIGIHIFYWYSGGPGFGARYWYLTIVPCVALTARSIQYLVGRLQSGPAIAATRGAGVLVGVLSLCLLTFFNFFPWRAIDKYHHYRSIRTGIQRLAMEYGFGRSLILIRGNRHVDYASAAIFNPVNFQIDRPIYAWDRSPEIRTKLLESYSDRNVWIVNGPTITRKGFEVQSGPFSASELNSMMQNSKTLHGRLIQLK